MELASDVEGLRLAMGSALGREYRILVADDGSVVGMWRIAATSREALGR